MTLSTTAIEEKNKLATESVFLAVLEITIPGLSDTVRVVNNNEDIVWRGETWTAVPFTIDDLSDQSTSTVPSVTVQIDNVNRVMDQYLQQYDSYVKANGFSPVTTNIYVINTKAIAVRSVTSITRVSTTATVVCSDHKFSTGQDVYISGADQDDYNGLFTVTVTDSDTFTYTVENNPVTPATGTITAQLATPEVSHTFDLKKPSATDTWATFVLGATNPFNRRFPANRILANSCRFRFKDARCKYSGVETSCDHTLARCRELNNSVRFGGFPGVAKGGF